MAGKEGSFRYISSKLSDLFGNFDNPTSSFLFVLESGKCYASLEENGRQFDVMEYDIR